MFFCCAFAVCVASVSTCSAVGGLVCAVTAVARTATREAPWTIDEWISCTTSLEAVIVSLVQANYKWTELLVAEELHEAIRRSEIRQAAYSHAIVGNCGRKTLDRHITVAFFEVAL